MTHYSSIKEATLSLKKFYKNGDIKNSLELCNAIEKADPSNKVAKKIKSKITNNNPFLIPLKEVEKLFNDEFYDLALLKCEELISKGCNHSQLFNTYGAILNQKKEFNEALNLLNKSLSIDNKNIAAKFNKGLVLHNLKNYEESIFVLEELVNSNDFNENDFQSFFILGMNYIEIKNIDKSSYYLKKSISINDKFVPSLINLANNYSYQERYNEAIKLFNDAKSLDKNNSLIFYNLGNLFEKIKQFDNAIESFETAINLKKDFYQAHSNLGTIYKNNKQNNEKAIYHFDQAILYNKDFDDAWSNKSSFLEETGNLDDALKCVQMAVKINPSNYDAYYNYGNIAQKLGDITTAIEMYKKSIKLNDTKVEPKWNFAISNLLNGNFTEGWKGFEIRRQRDTWIKRAMNGKELKFIDQLKNKTILVYSEQGLGDTINFARFCNLLVPYAKKVILEVQKPIRLILSDIKDVEVIEKTSKIIQTDFNIPLMSIPKLLNVNSNDIPPPTLIKTDFEITKNWDHIFDDKKINIGISWQGSKSHGDDKKIRKYHRSFPLNSFNDLKDHKDINFISLQKEDVNAEELSLLDINIQYLGTEFDDHDDAFVDTIQILKRLDLVITCDTSLAHLAGSLNVPVWVALKFIPDWRWLMERKTSIYYPSMTLFRQKSWGDWTTVFEDMNEQLKEFKNESY